MNHVVTIGFSVVFVKDVTMSLLPEIEKRFSHEEFEPTSVDRTTLLRIVDAGRLAPSAKNRQAWRFVVITDGSLKTKITEAGYGQECLSSASALIALCTTNIDYKMPNGQLSYPVDLSVAGAFMMIQTEHEGLNSCPVTTFSEPDVSKLLTLPYGMKIVMILAVGKAKGEKSARNRVALEKIVSWNSW